MLRRYLRKLTFTEASTVNDATKVSVRDPLEFSLCYKLRRDALEITAKMPGDGKGLSADARSKRLLWVQSRLIEAMCCDPSISERQRFVLMTFHSKAVRDLIADRRGARLRTNLTRIAA